jgi:hypothetical protein
MSVSLRQRGRRSHRRSSTMLEVVAWRPATRESVVVSGFGHRSQRYRNVLAGQAVQVQVARLRWSVRCCRSWPASATTARTPRRRVVDALPMVAFRPLD